MKIKDVASAASIARIEEYVRLLDRWRRITNLISDDSFQDVWERHVIDSIGLQQTFPAAARWLDFGSGAGFPGVILGIMLADRSGAQIHCVESDGRKCAFLRTVAQTLRIPVKVHNRRAEGLTVEDTGYVEIVTARAFSSVDKILALSELYLRSSATLVLPRGKTSAIEVEEIDTSRYTLNVHANPTAGGGTFLQIQLRARGL